MAQSLRRYLRLSSSAYGQVQVTLRLPTTHDARSQSWRLGQEEASPTFPCQAMELDPVGQFGALTTLTLQD